MKISFIGFSLLVGFSINVKNGYKLHHLFVKYVKNLDGYLSAVLLLKIL